MITKWGLKKFKSIRETELELAPLTILTGVNSSGKSSFLQSIAMLAQSAKNNGDITINGNLVNMVHFNQIFCQNIFQDETDDVWNTIGVNFTISPVGSINKNICLEFEYGFFNNATRIQHSKLIPPKFLSFYMESKEGETGDDTVYVKYHRDEGTSFDPASYNEIKNNLPQYRDKTPDSFKLDILLSRENKLHDEETPNFLPEKIKISRNESVEMPPKLKEARDYLHEYLGSKVKYLGPLRQEPQYGYDRLEHYEDVDARGINTAAVIDYMCKKGSVKRYITPEVKDFNEKEKEHFSSALYEWIKYILFDDNFSIDFNIQELQSKKIKFKIYSDGGGFFLNQLGTGVTWILPILVMCLAAEPDSTIIIQQPEEHLHPKVQSRLADFFIAMALSGRQCLIETHSEYLIEQLRYRIVKSPIENPLHDKVKLYFVTKRDGVSFYKDMEIDEFAAPSDWPEDFFDESHILANKIMDESIKKKKSGRRHE